jgi:hypothetical protein
MLKTQYIFTQYININPAFYPLLKQSEKKFVDNLPLGKIPVSSGILACKQFACGNV